MSRYGRGETQFVTLSEDGSAAAKKFHERVRTPVLTDIAIDWNGLEVSDVYPQNIPDLFSAKPLVINGRFSHGGKRTIHLRGKVAGRPYEKSIEVDLAAAGTKHDVLATFWARRKVEHLTASNFRDIQYGRPNEEVKQAITQLGLNFRLMTQFTSFVAVEDKVVNEGGQSRRVEVPVEMPEGVSYEGVYGEPRMAKSMAYRSASPAGFGGGFLSSADSTARNSAAPQPVPIQREQIRVRPAILKDKEEQGPADVMTKVHASLQTLQPGTVIRVQVWLVNADASVIAKLKAAGLTVESASGSLVTGRVDAGKLRALAALSEVRMVSPAPVR